MHGRSTIETIYLLREIIEKYWNGRRDIHMVFIDLEQMYDWILRDVLSKFLHWKRNGWVLHISKQFKMCMVEYGLMLEHQEVRWKYFPIMINLHQGSFLSLYLFNLEVDVLT